MNNSIPICLYSLNKIVLDDDTAFSDSMLLRLHGNKVTSYNSPKKALQFILEEYQPTFTKSELLFKNTQISDSSSQHSININIDKLMLMLNNPPHRDISVILIDYHMPEMNGIDLLHQIKHLPIKKALITGEDDYKIGVDAFNSNLVDAYLRKDDPNFPVKLKDIIDDLEWKYFTELSAPITDLPDFHYLRNNALIQAFKKFIRENNITAFCLTHSQGDFITYNTDQKKNRILIRSKSQLLELAKNAGEDGGCEKTINNLILGNVIPFFDCLEYWQVPASEWPKYLLPAAVIPGDPNLFWAVVEV